MLENKSKWFECETDDTYVPFHLDCSEKKQKGLSVIRLHRGFMREREQGSAVQCVLVSNASSLIHV